MTKTIEIKFKKEGTKIKVENEYFEIFADRIQIIGYYGMGEKSSLIELYYLNQEKFLKDNPTIEEFTQKAKISFEINNPPIWEIESELDRGRKPNWTYIIHPTEDYKISFE